MTIIDDTPTEVLPRIPRVPAVDETGGLELFIDMLDLRTKNDASTVATEPDDEQDSDAPNTSPQPVLQPAENHAPGFLRRTLIRVKAAISRAVATVREARAWLFSEVPNFNPKLITRFRNRFLSYQGKHHVRRAWYGRQLSTSAAVAVTRERHARAQQTSRTKEGVLSSYFELPEYWTSYMADLVQIFRDEQLALHPAAGRHWQCN